MKLNILDCENENYKDWSMTIGILYDESYKDKYFLIKEEDLNDDDCFLIPISVAGLKGYLSIFGENDGKTFLDIFSDRIKKLVKENNGFILVSWFAEGHITQQNYKDLHNELKKHNIPANKIMFLASDMNGNIQYDKFCDRNNIKDKIHIFEASHRLEASVYYYNIITNGIYDKEKMDNIHPYPNSFFTVDEMFEMEDTIREKYFLSYNRVIREYRLALVSMLYDLGFDKKGIISLGAKEYNDEHGGIWPDKITDFLKNEEENNLVSTAMEKIKHLYPIKADQDIIPNTIFDEDGNKIGGAIGDFNNFSHQYKRVYFNIVTESSYYDECIYFSEKTFRPIGQLTPFILMSTPYSLAKLREIGFKTFNGWIDERYDNEEDNDKRFFMILDEIKRLCNMSKEELHDWYYSLTDILIHNQKTLRDYQPVQDTLDMKSPDRIRIWKDIFNIIF
jgi:hypothetical protein|tara:strand:- start:70 stop:1416 length:1347 start_codon:yes stop_codon:yes gene_type:complete